MAAFHGYTLARFNKNSMFALQTFVKVVNYTHLMPTRYNLSDVDLKKVISTETTDNAEKKKEANKVLLIPALLYRHDMKIMVVFLSAFCTAL